MKNYLAVIMLILGATCVGVIAQGNEDPDRMHHELELRQRHLELETRQAELEFQRQMHEIELDERRSELKRRRLGHDSRGHDDGGGFVLVLIFAVINILLTVWVYQDIRARSVGSGLWIPVTLIAGFFGALLYLLARLGDNKAE